MGKLTNQFPGSQENPVLSKSGQLVTQCLSGKRCGQPAPSAASPMYVDQRCTSMHSTPPGHGLSQCWTVTILIHSKPDKNHDLTSTACAMLRLVGIMPWSSVCCKTPLRPPGPACLNGSRMPPMGTSPTRNAPLTCSVIDMDTESQLQLDTEEK